MTRPTPRQAQAALQATKLLFATCARIRFQVRAHHQGASHKALRQAFGEGMRAAAARPADVRTLARQILRGAAAHPQALRWVQAGRAALRRVQLLLTRVELLAKARRVPS